MSAVATIRNLLDEPESRFPLDLGIRIPKIRNLYRLATAKQWDPVKAIPWDTLRPEDYSEEQRLAARMYWSRRTWSEYGAISETPALQIRFCQQKHASDLRFFFTLRTQEESRHAEVSYLFAEKLGGYIPEPKKAAFQNAVATHGVRKMAPAHQLCAPGALRLVTGYTPCHVMNASGSDTAIRSFRDALDIGISSRASFADFESEPVAMFSHFSESHRFQQFHGCLVSSARRV